MLKISIFILILCSFFGSFGWTAEGAPFSKIAIAIATPGPGASIMGHAFLLFLSDENKKSESVAVQFNVYEDPNSAPAEGIAAGVTDFFGYSKSFQIQFAPGLDMINQYRSENRSILLFYVKLDPSQIQTIWNHLLEEKQERENGKIKDYSFLNHNCLTESFRSVNAVITDPAEQFFYFDRDRKALSYFITSFSLPLFIRNAPFAAVLSLKQHPLIYAREAIQPAIVSEGSVYVKLYQSISTLADKCIRGDDLKKNLSSILGKEEIRQSKAFLDYLQKVELSCDDSSSKDLYNDIINTIYLLAPDLQNKMKIEAYFL